MPCSKPVAGIFACRALGFKALLANLAALFVIIAAFTILPTNSYAESPDDVKTVDAEGISVIADNNSATARDGAVDDALRKAVEQAVGMLVSAESMVQDYQVLSDKVYTKTQGYVKNYKIIAESRDANIYKVTVKATVALGAIKNDLDALGVLHAKVEKPRVLFMVAEQSIGQAFLSFWWGRSEAVGEVVSMPAAETELKSMFLEKGFNVVDVSGSSNTFEISNAYKIADLKADGAKTFGKKLNAEIVVMGKAIAKEVPRSKGSSIGIYNADVSISAVRVDDGSVLASASGHGVARHISEVTGGVEALKKATGEAGNKMIEQIIAKWTKGNNIIVKLTGATDYDKVAAFKEHLRRIRGVTAVYQRSFEGQTAQFEVETKVTTQTVADEIQRLPGKPAKVVNTTQNTIEAAMEQPIAPAQGQVKP